ncbi:Proteasome assembly chaperone 2 [Nowakowskiella sp. JEL0407]|nr:Proteasome assembly chaperone 2 [Nowakowskiella sp. JEL0407]
MRYFGNNILPGGTLILSSANSVGLVGNMAVDMVLQSLNCATIGVLESKYLVPLSGINKSGNGLNSALEVYTVSNVDSNYTFLLHRTPTIPRKAHLFCTELRDWIIKQKFSRVIVLSSAVLEGDKELLDKRTRVLKVSAASSLSPYVSSDFLEHADVPTGSGVLRLLKELDWEGIDVVSLIIYAGTNDYITSAKRLADQVSNTFFNGLPVIVPVELMKVFGNGGYTKELFG